MFQKDYKREVGGVSPSAAPTARLDPLLTGEATRRPRRATFIIRPKAVKSQCRLSLLARKHNAGCGGQPQPAPCQNVKGEKG